MKSKVKSKYGFDTYIIESKQRIDYNSDIEGEMTPFKTPWWITTVHLKEGDHKTHIATYQFDEDKYLKEHNRLCNEYRNLRNIN